MAGSDARGRTAHDPRQIPWRGWKDVGRRVWDESKKDNLSMVAGGVAFYGFLALFPAMAAVVSIYGMIAEPQTVQQQLQQASGVLPPAAQDLVGNQLGRLAGASGSALGIGFAVSLLGALWAATKGTKALITAFNIAYDEEESRGFFKLNAVAFGLTVALIVFFVVTLLLVAAIPPMMSFLPLPGWAEWTLRLVRWPIVIGFVIVALGLLYRYAPSRDSPRWSWASPGAIAATTLWLLGSVAFSVYVANFGTYNKTYGTLAAVAVLLLWFFISAYSVLLGAEVNAEAERQTRRDTTEGPAQPMGRRRARAADTLGEARKRK